ncbi:methylmalonyl-CoA mutase family protein [Bergeyella sp. RCAD1439]|uniref:methylmalonyl-CoA mutase family protein n=1 Tax=Bergeyella anatis TaxID=3113737 RepID=UPI002E194EAF|nr:methylmalonyl-CoA mutase family protein [Bergeyella sp. RCAD1439]
MNTEGSLHQWEELVRKQLKTDDLYGVLSKPNLEGLTVKPYYDASVASVGALPKVEESPHLVSYYWGEQEDSVLAYFIDRAVSGLSGKTLFIGDRALARVGMMEPENRYFCMADPIFENEKRLDEELGKTLLSRGFSRALGVDVALLQNAGASMVQQVALALAKVKELTEVFGAEVFGQLILRVAVGGNYFFEIAKLRALKLAYNQLSKEFGLNEIPYLFVETSMRNKSVYDEENNLIRSTLEVASAMIGGGDAVFSGDFKLKASTALSRETAFKQQILLAYESLINVFDDAAGGSYYVEDLTLQIARRAWADFLTIEESGGYLANLRNGRIQEAIYAQALEEQKWVEEGKMKLVGVNLYPSREKQRSAESMYRKGEIRAVRLSEMFE